MAHKSTYYYLRHKDAPCDTNQVKMKVEEGERASITLQEKLCNLIASWLKLCNIKGVQAAKYVEEYGKARDKFVEEYEVKADLDALIKDAALGKALIIEHRDEAGSVDEEVEISQARGCF